MTFVELILKNLFRQPVRAGLTVLGIGVGITTVVALGFIMGGVKSTAEGILRMGGSDFMVAQEGTADLSFSVVSEADWAALDRNPDIQRTFGVLMHITQLGDNPYFVLGGVRPENLKDAGVDLVAGSFLSPDAADEVMLGSGAAGAMGAVVGDTVTIDDHPFKVVGIYDSDLVWQRNGSYGPLATVQQMANRPGVVTAVFVKLKEGFDRREVASAIERDSPQLVTVLEVSEYGEVDQGIQLMDALNLAVSVLAVGIGAIGVMNTMVMSVFERTREIGILRAVGWRGPRILRMVIGESLVLCVIAAFFGAAMGMLATQAVMLIPTVQSFLEPQYTLDVFVRGLAVAVFVALAGAAYPAYRAVRLVPMEALRYE